MADAFRPNGLSSAWLPAPIYLKGGSEASMDRRRWIIFLSTVVLVLSALGGLAAAATGFFGLAHDKAVEEVEERSSYHEEPWLREDPKPGEEQDEVSTEEEEHREQSTGATD